MAATIIGSLLRPPNRRQTATRFGDLLAGTAASTTTRTPRDQVKTYAPDYAALARHSGTRLGGSDIWCPPPAHG